MNAREEIIADRYTKQGWKVLRGGAPDFLMLKVESGEMRRIMAVEVKNPHGDLSYEQRVYKTVLEQAGIQYIVEVVD